MADRSYVMQQLSIYADAPAMKARYGIDITDQQIQLAKKTLDFYYKIDDKKLKAMSDEQALRWPYRLSPEQRLDAELHTRDIKFTIPQPIIWKTLRPIIPAEDYQNIQALIQAVQDIEGFMQLNAYLGNFTENNALINNKENKLMILFAMAYKSHVTA